jgi:spore maturation protein CgeB
MRTFEIPGAGGFMMHESSNEAQEIFLPDREAVYFSNPGEFAEKAQFYLKNVSLRQKIAEVGYKKATSFDCSYQQRVMTIVNTL